MKDTLLENLHRASQQSDKSCLDFLVLAALFVLIQNGTINLLDFAGASIPEPDKLLWAIAGLSSVQYYRLALALALEEEIWKELWRRYRNPEEPFDRMDNPEFRLSMPPSIFRLSVAPPWRFKTKRETMVWEFSWLLLPRFCSRQYFSF